MNILFYTPFFERSRDTETLMIAFREQGHKVYFITQQKEGIIFSILKEKNISVFSLYTKAPLYLKIIIHVIKLIRFCYKYKIDIVYSHLEPANLVAVISQYFVKAKVIICRHHIDEIHLLKAHQSFSYKFIYSHARQIIVVSNRAKEFMVKYESIAPEKIIKINLAYDFKLYSPVNISEVEKIRNEYKADLLIITACRLLKDKRPELSIDLVQKLLEQGLNVKLILLGKGELYNKLQEKIVERKLEDSCFLLGFQRNMLDYISAADVLFHPSILDSSSVIIKEAGLVDKPAITCKDVGDVEDYIRNLENGILVDRDDPIPETINFLTTFIKDKEHYSYMGKNLHKNIISLFSIENILPIYDTINKK